MSSRSVTGLALLVALAGVVCMLAVPGRRGDSPSPPAGTPPGAAPEEVAFQALVAGTAAPEERRHLVDTLRAMGPSALARFLRKTVGDSAPEDSRLVALECLEGCATGREVRDLVRLASPGKSAPSGNVCEALRSSVLATLARDARAYGELVPAWRDAGRDLRGELLSAVGERGDPAGLELLAWVATFEGAEYHRALAEACLRLAPRAPGPEAREHLETLCSLLGSEDAVCVQTLSTALARARVEAAIPAWIGLLASESRGTRERARRSLEEVTGLALGPAAERWLAWHRSEGAWFEDEAPALLSDLESEDGARVAGAVRSLSRHRLHRDELADAIAGLLEHPAPALRLCACSALESLGSPLALPALTAALADEDAAVARAAGSALRHLTGLDLPADEALWRERLAAPF